MIEQFSLPGSRRFLVIIPAWNEELSVGGVIASVREAVPGAPVIVIDDCSEDATASVAAAAGATTIRLPCHLGLGGCVQTGYKFGFEHGFDYVIRIDADGQHDPKDIPRIVEALEETGCEMVIGSRYLGPDGHFTSFLRRVGIVFLRLLLRGLLSASIRDPTSGFVGVNRRALAVFERVFPLSYPEIEILAVLQRRRFRFHEIPTTMFRRQAGRSSIAGWKHLHYLTCVVLGVFINVLKYDGPAPPPRQVRD
ncbi:MAG: glycosyltransferase family 2 protein [Terriglobia bacterium]